MTQYGELTFRRPVSILFPFPAEGVRVMKVILQETLEGIGHLGDLIDVSDGFARNYLLPRRKALEANSRNIKAFEHAKRVMAEKAKKERLEIEALAKKISAVSLTVIAQVGKDDKMFGSVTAKDIAEGLAEQGFTVDRRKIQLAQPIKELGTFTVPVKLPRDITASVTVHVVKKQEPEASAKE
jgi:large subunit ribosomal protein L9